MLTIGKHIIQSIRKRKYYLESISIEGIQRLSKSHNQIVLIPGMFS